MNGEYPYCKTEPFMDELKKAAFNAIYKDGCDNCGDWIDTLVNCYSEEVVDTLGNNPNEVYADWKIYGKPWIMKTLEPVFA